MNPGLIYCSVTGFGHSGPWRERPGYDFMIQGMGGLMSVTGERDDRAGGGPQKAGIPIADLITGMYASVAICAALAHRAKSGQGQHLDLALLDSLVAVLANQGANYLATGQSPGRLGNDHPNIAPYQVLQTADGSFIVACGNDNLFGKFSQVIGRPELADDARFATNGKRVANRAELTRIISEITAKRSMRHWLDALEGAGVPCGPINDLKQVFEEPQAVARGLTDGAAASDRGQGSAHPKPDAFLRNAGAARNAAPDAGAAHRRGAEGVAEEKPLGDRTAALRGDRLAL